MVMVGSGSSHNRGHDKRMYNNGVVVVIISHDNHLVFFFETYSILLVALLCSTNASNHAMLRICNGQGP